MVNLFGFDPKDKGSIPLPSANMGEYSVEGSGLDCKSSA